MSDDDDLGFSALSPELREAMEVAHERAAALGYAAPDVEAEPPDDDAWAHETEDEPPPPEDGLPVCVYCRATIESTRHAYRRVVAWERKRKQGGTNAVRLREPLDEFACSRCVDAIADGRDPGQRPML